MNQLRIAERLVQLRHEKKITQEALADFIGVTKASVSKWENAQSTPDITTLPLLASYFDVTIDELVGYTPQLTKDQIRTLYRRFGRAFASRPFEEVMQETKEYVRQYYSCYPFLLQICLLWLNHVGMADSEQRQSEIFREIDNLCIRIQQNCSDLRINQNAVSIRALISFQLGKVQEVIDMLEPLSVSGIYAGQNNVLLSRSYAMLGKTEEADEFTQVCLYSNLLNLLSDASIHLMLHAGNPTVCDETIRRIERIAEVFDLDHLHPNAMLSFEYQAVISCLTNKEKEKALHHCERYADLLALLFSSPDLKLHGDAYFDRIEDWFDRELDNGSNPPRSRDVVLEDARKTLDAPPFAELNGDPAFETARQRVRELK